MGQINTRPKGGLARKQTGYNALTYRTRADLGSAIVGAALVALSLAYIRSDLIYDEAVYLQLARSIADTGVPLRRNYDDFTRFHLFENSPPLVIYVAAATQKLFPRDELPTRVIQFIAFALPSYAIVWWVARAEFGRWAACASLLAVATIATYVRAAPHVLLDIPLGFLACLTLIAFVAASQTQVRRGAWLMVVAVGTALAVWTKYQAICLVPAVLVFVVYEIATRRGDGLRGVRASLVAMVIGGAVAVVALIGFFWSVGGRAELIETLMHNGERIHPEPTSIRESARAILAVGWRCVTTLGPAAMMLAAFAPWGPPRQRRLVVVLASYVAASLAFNLVLFRLPGAGSSYLAPIVPALAVLGGAGAVRLISLAPTAASRALLASALLAVQIAGASAARYDRPRPNGSRIAAAYIADHSAPAAGVLADTVAVEFYADRPVRPISFTFPREIVLRSLEGTSADNISYVVIDSTAPPKNIDAIRSQWNALLARFFERVSAGAPGLDVYRRRSVNLQQDK